MTATHTLTGSPSSGVHSTPVASTERGQFGAVLVLTVTLASAAVLALMALQLMLIHPGITGFGGHTGLFNQQNQKVKTDLYFVTFVVVLPVALVVASRLVDAIDAGPNRGAAPLFAALLAGMLASALILVRLSGGLPWGTGVKGLLAGVVAWAALGGAATWRTIRRGQWPALQHSAAQAPIAFGLAAALVFGVLLCLTSLGSLSLPALLLAAAGSVGVLVAYGRFSFPSLARLGGVLDLAVIVILVLAIPDLVVFRNPAGIPNFLFDPGLVQFQHDWILGPTNQLLGGGALLTGDPLSQYGVGLIYFLAGWFHLAPIGYGTFGFLDGVLTALFYGAGYAVLRLAGVRRLLAMAAIAAAVLTFVYHFQYFVGQLPEEGPLRFGLPMLALLGMVAAQRGARGGAGRALALSALGISAIWAFEAFAYTAFTYVCVATMQAWLRDPGTRRRGLMRELAFGFGACVLAHVAFALATLAGSGHLPDWGQYLAYLHEFLFGGTAGTITYGFADWSPGLAVGGATLASAAAIVLLVLRRPAIARANPGLAVALTGTTAYSVALLSYVDNRSSTYLLLYMALPLLLGATLWLALALRSSLALPLALRRGLLAGALAVATLLFASAWPTIGGHFSRTALAKLPGGGLTASLHRLWHPPAIDPRSVSGIQLLDRYIPGKRAMILFPTLPDLGDEILMRSRRANLLPIGDPKADGLVESVWLPRMRVALRRIGPGQRLLTDRTALAMLPALRKPGVDPLQGAIAGGGIEVEWILQWLDRRFRIVQLAHGPQGLLIAHLVRR